MIRPHRDHRSGWGRFAHTTTTVVSVAVLAGWACGPEDPLNPVSGTSEFDAGRCSLDPAFIKGVVPPNFIKALDLPVMVAPDAPPSPEHDQYLSDADRVLGIVIDGVARAYPHRVLEQHEIVNDRIGDQWVSITYCPLTGSGIAFEPLVGSQRLDLGVSGLLFANNLVVYDRTTGELYGPQLSVVGMCDAFRSVALRRFPVQEMSWARWKQFHPDTEVVGALGNGDPYTEELYAGYADLDNPELWYPGPTDQTRPPKERVLVLRVDEGGRGYPFGELEALGSTAVVNEVVAGTPTVILYEALEGGNAVAYEARVDGAPLELEVDGIGVWRDVGTGSRWTLDGVAIDGPLAGARLTPRTDAYVAYWFAWRHFQPDGETFTS